MSYFDVYSSNSLAAAGNQFIFESDGNEKMTGIIFYKIFHGGKYGYSFLYSNILDSTYSDGSQSNCNMICNEWEIYEASVAVTKDVNPNGLKDSDFIPLTFDGKSEKTVAPGEFFATDRIELSPEKNDYFCIKLVFSGTKMPYHPEAVIPSFRLINGEWVDSRCIPFCGCIGCDRPIDKKIAYWGDSITQGCGTPVNSYTHWAAVLSELLGENNSYWDIGLGYGRGADAGSLGAWTYKAKHNDYVFICFGVNDILQGYSAEEIKKNLNKTVDFLNKNGVKVILQTVPPFDYANDKTVIWADVNNYIKTVLSNKVYYVFDNIPVLSVGKDKPNMAKYGGHPNVEGSKVWAEALFPTVNKIIK